MQSIAAENGHNETAFVVRRTDGEFDLRWFTPKIEDDLCGHATLAAAFVLALRKHDAWPIRFHTRSGVLTVAREQNGFELDFPARPPQLCEARPELLPARGLKRAEVMKSSRDYLVVVREAERVRTLSPDIAALARLDLGIGGAIVTAPGLAMSITYAGFFRLKLASTRIPRPDRSSARPGPIGARGWVRRGSKSNN